MPYSKTMRRRRRYQRKPTTVKKIARVEAKKVVNQNIETKMFDGITTLASVSYTGSALRLLYNYLGATAIQQGVGDNAYIGTSIKPVGLSLRLAVYGADYTNKISVLVWQNKGLFNPVSNTLQSVLQNTGNVEAPLSPLNRSYNDRMRMLYRKTFIVGESSTTDPNIPYARIFTIYIPARKLRHLKFSDNVGNVEKGDLWFGIISDSGAASHPSFEYTSRVYYQDA